MLSLNGVMIGVNCAVLCMTGTNVRTTTDWRGEHPLGWKVYYKKNSVSSWAVKDCDSDGDTVFFRDSSFQCELTGLSANTTYKVYFTQNNSETSNTLTFTTITASPNDFDINLIFSDVDDPDTQDSVRDNIDVIVNAMRNIGVNLRLFDRNITKPDITCYATLPEGVGALTHGRKGMIDIKPSTPISSIVHEFRHYFFCSSEAESGFPLGRIGYVSQSNIISSENYDANNIKETVSFFSMNKGKGDIFMFYGENSCDNNDCLYDYFILKALANNHVDILWKQ